MIQLINFMLRNTFLLPSCDLSFIFGIISTLGKCRQHPFWWNRNKEIPSGLLSYNFWEKVNFIPLVSNDDGQKDWSNEDDVVDWGQNSGEDHGVQLVIKGYRPVELYKKKGWEGITLFLSIYQYLHTHSLIAVSFQ